jgi:hypothetical protein
MTCCTGLQAAVLASAYQHDELVPCSYLPGTWLYTHSILFTVSCSNILLALPTLLLLLLLLLMPFLQLSSCV